MEELPADAFLTAYPPPVVDTADRLRAAVARIVPDAVERVRPGWRVIGYDVPIGRRTAYFAFVMPEIEHVHLGFEHGVLLADSERRLRGAGITRRVRWLTYRPGEPVEQAAIEAFLSEAARLARLGRAARLALALDRETGLA